MAEWFWAGRCQTVQVVYYSQGLACIEELFLALLQHQQAP